MTVPRRFRIGRRGHVHEMAPGMTMTARCGQLIDAGEPTEDPVTCLTCSGHRVHRGGRRRRRGTGADSYVALTDRALAQLERLTAAAHDAWRRREQAARHMMPPLDAYPAPPEPVSRLIVHLQERFDGRRWPDTLTSTVTAHEELLRLQGYLLPGGFEEAS